MQDGSWNQPLPISLLLKDPAVGGPLEGDGGVFSEASSDGDIYLDSMTQLDSSDGDFSDLTAFLSADEISRSLDLAREAFSDVDEPGDPDPPIPPIPQEQVLQTLPSLPTFSMPHHTTDHLTKSPSHHHQTKAPCRDDSGSVKITSSQSVLHSMPIEVSSESPVPAETFVCHKSITPVYKQDKPRLVHEGLELSDRSASATEFCSRAATFIEELSSIFKGSARLEQQGEEDSSSPDSGYLSPRSQRPAPQGSVSVPPQPLSQQGGPQPSQPVVGPQLPGLQAGGAGPMGYQQSGAQTTSGPLSPPRFSQKLKSQEVAEGTPIRLECRVGGNPLPLVR